MLDKAVDSNALFLVRVIQRVDSGLVVLLVHMLDINLLPVIGDMFHCGRIANLLCALCVHDEASLCKMKEQCKYAFLAAFYAKNEKIPRFIDVISGICKNTSKSKLPPIETLKTTCDNSHQNIKKFSKYLSVNDLQFS